MSELPPKDCESFIRVVTRAMATLAPEARGVVVPVVCEMIADLLTPLTAYRRLDRDPSDPPFLLESVEGGERWARWSFIGLATRRRLVVTGNRLTIATRSQTSVIESADPLAALGDEAAAFVPVATEGLPRFWGGLVGVLGYDVVRFVERLPRLAIRDLPLPDAVLVEPGVVVALDGLRQRANLICPIPVERGAHSEAELAAAWEQAQAALSAVRARLRGVEPESVAAIVLEPLPTEPVESLDRAEFCRAVLRAKEYIAAGDVIQVVLSRRLELPRPFGVEALELYRALRLMNPSPYMFCFRFPAGPGVTSAFEVVGASPEVLVRREADTVTVRPIAGTRRRGPTPEEDAAIEAELRADPKELAEHVMLVDLGRNDVGRLAVPGTVRVTDRFIVERYSHVMHLVSQVEGTVPKDTRADAVIRATFPAGTLSGAPKVRALEIIEELEPTGRGVYGGAVGYLGYDGTLDLAIAIRSIVGLPASLLVQTGAGVVYDSEPEREFEETREKARGVLAAIRLARQLGGA